jgi:hypothetical protein
LRDSGGEDGSHPKNQTTMAESDHSEKPSGMENTIERLATEAYQEKKKTEPEFAKLLARLEKMGNIPKDPSELTLQTFREQLVLFRIWGIGFVLWMMALETIAIFLIVVLDSLPIPMLNVDKLTLQILVGATITQVSTMFYAIIRSVFSDTLNRLICKNRDLT